MSRGVAITIVCEDRRHEGFVHAVLMAHYGWSKARLKRRVRTRPYPKDGTGGAGEKHVRDSYPVEVEAYRRGPSHRAVIAVIDADNHSVDERHRQLDAALQPRPRTQAEAIIHVIPKRAIETWLCFLDGTPVIETDSFKFSFRGDGAKLKALAKALCECFVPDEPCASGAPESLSLARREFQRFLDTVRLG